MQGINEVTIPNVLEYYNAATEHDTTWYKVRWYFYGASIMHFLKAVLPRMLTPSSSLQAWHAWAVMNFEAVLHFKHHLHPREEKKKVRHPSNASANTEGSESESEGESVENSPVPSPVQKKPSEVIIWKTEQRSRHSKL